MLNTNNTVNYEINVKRKEKKYSWSTVFAWLYLKTVGRILPKKWNKWAENILYYDKATGSNEIHTDGLKTTDESAQIDLKPGVAVKESQSEVISKDGEVQTNKVTFHDIAMQTECVETTDKNSDQAQRIADLQLENGLLEVKIEGLQSTIIRLKADLQSKNGSLIKENGELHIANEELIKSSKELVKLLESSRKSSAGLEECYERKLTECKAEFTDKIDELLERVGEVRKKNSLMSLNERSGEDQKAMVENLKRQLQSIQESKQQLEKEKIDLEGKLKDLSNQLSTAEVEKKSSENEVARLQEQVEHLNAELERVRSIAISSIGECTKTLDENLKLKNQQIESSTTEHGQQNAKEKSRNGNVQKGQTKVQKPDAESCMGTVSKTTNRIKGIPNSLINSSVSVQQSGKIR